MIIPDEKEEKQLFKFPNCQLLFSIYNRVIQALVIFTAFFLF